MSEKRLTADTIAASALYATGGNVPTPEERAAFKRSELEASRAMFAPQAPIVDLFEEVRRWVSAIGCADPETGRRYRKADALEVIDRVLGDLR